MVRWSSGDALAIHRSWITALAVSLLSCADSRQIAHTQAPLSLSSIIWYINQTAVMLYALLRASIHLQQWGESIWVLQRGIVQSTFTTECFFCRQSSLSAAGGITSSSGVDITCIAQVSAVCHTYGDVSAMSQEDRPAPWRHQAPSWQLRGTASGWHRVWSV